MGCFLCYTLTVKKLTNVKLNKLIWEEVKRINRLHNLPICYTCGKQNLSGSNWQAGHGKARSVLPLKGKNDLRNIKSQCMRCNVDCGGMTDIFIAKLEKEKDGLDFLNEFCVKVNGYWEMKSTPLMGSVDSWIYLTNLLDEYKKIV